MSDYGSGDELFDGAEAEAVLNAVSPARLAPSPVKRKLEDEDSDEFDELLADEFANLDPKKPKLEHEGADTKLDPGLSELARTILRETFGYGAFRLEQEAAISSILRGRNAMVVMPTGGGKSLCYQVPALAFEHLDKASGDRKHGHHGITIIVSPLLALMKDQVDALKRKGVAAESIDSTKTWEEQQKISAMMRDGTLRLLYCAPERLNNEGFIENLKHMAGGIRLVAVDEAHCISEWGHQFRPDYLKVARFVKEVKAERAICLTATATTKVIEDVCGAFAISLMDVHRTSPYRPNLRLLAEAVQAGDDKLPLLLDFLRKHKGPTLIYVTAQHQSVELAKSLVSAKFRAVAFHAGMSTDDKQYNQIRFMSDEVDIVVATIAFGMGIDKANIRNVIHYGIPGSVEEYSQQVGRAGRDGKPSSCMFYLCPEDLDVRSVHAYGDTPTRKGVLDLLSNIFDDEVTSLPVNGVFKRSHYGQGNDYDIRSNPLSVIYAILELRFGLIRAVTPEYGQYKFKPGPQYEAIISKDQSDAGRAVKNFASKPPRGVNYNMDIQYASRSMGINRNEIVRKLNDLHDRGVVQLTASGLENRYRVMTDKLPRTPGQLSSLADDIITDLQQREVDAVRRINEVIGMVTGARCFALALALHFDMDLPDEKKQCGHCGFCETGKAVAMPSAPPRPAATMDLLMDILAVVSDRDDARLLTRIGFGITSPRTKKMKISSSPVFGSLHGHDFELVLREFTKICDGTVEDPTPKIKEDTKVVVKTERPSQSYGSRGGSGRAGSYGGRGQSRGRGWGRA